MPKFTKFEREQIKSMVRTYSIFKLTDHELIARIKDTSDFDISQPTLTRIKCSLKRESLRWYIDVMSKRHEFIAMIKENYDTINELKKLTLDNYLKADQLHNLSEKRKNLELALKIEEDIARYLDALQFIGCSRPASVDNWFSQSSNASNNKCNFGEDNLKSAPF